MEEKQAARTRTAESSKKWGKAALIAAAALAGVLTGCMLGLGFYANGCDEVFPGVRVEGTDLSGLDRGELERVLETDSLLSGAVIVQADGEDLGTYPQARLGAVIDREALAEQAWSVGREPGVLGWLKNAWTMFRGKTGTDVNLSATVTSYDGAVLRQAAEEMACYFDRPAVDGSYELTPEGLFATKGMDGRRLDQEGLVRQMEALGGQGGVIDAPWEAVGAQPLDLQELSRQLDSSASPAYYDTAAGRVVDGQPGARLDAEAAAYVLEAAEPGERVLLPAQPVYPELTAQELEAVLFRDVLGTASTNVSGSPVRRKNVELSGQFVNGTVLNDGEEFNYNQVVGERTTARGFGAAPSYVNGQTVDTVGGGICQTSSTVYLAALLSNLEIVERYNHRYWPGYIDKGMDATVSWGGPEFRFRNNTGYPIRIDAAYQNSKLTVTILGTRTDDTYVEMDYEELSTTPYETQYQETDELPWGIQKELQSGYTGREVVTYRNVYDGSGNLLSRTEEARSSYKSRDVIILVGTAGKPEDGEEAPGDTSGGTGAPPAGSGSDSGLDITQPGGDEPELPPDYSHRS